MKLFILVAVSWAFLFNTVLAAGACGDIVISALKHYPTIATPFCSNWLKISPTTKTVTVTATPKPSPKPTKVAVAVAGGSSVNSYYNVPPGIRIFAKSKISSACSCLSIPTPTISVTKTITPTSSTSIKTSTTKVTSSSSKSSSITSSSITSSSVLSTSSTTIPITSSSTTSSSTSTSFTAPPSPSCEPEFKLSGIDEFGYNAKGAPFSASIPCSTLNTSMVAVVVNGVETNDFTTTTTTVNFPNGLQNDYAIVAIMGLDTKGYPFFSTYELLFGSYSLPVTITDAQGSPVANAQVEANATTYNGFSKSLVTDANGQVIFDNLPLITVGLVARTDDNQIAAIGVAANVGSVQLELIPFNPPSEEANYEFEDGSAGWTGGTLVGHVEKRSLDVTPYRGMQARTLSDLEKREDMDLVVSTAGTQSFQRASATFKTYSFTKTVYIKYKFVTAEIPGGYYGSKFNDYFIVTIRSDVGGLATVTNSMNNLGQAAFDASGATGWFTLRLSVPQNCKSVQFDVAVANVGDSAYDSQIVVDKAGDLTCDECGDCTKCPGDPMCSNNCQNPPARSCAFYRDCVEATVPCADKPASSYAINYGESNCNKYKNNLYLFSSAGQSFIWSTMTCLQQALKPAVNCDATCPAIKSAAFASHPGCYIQGGFCGLTCTDYAAVLWTIGRDLRAEGSLQQILATATGCLDHIVDQLKTGACVNQILTAILLAMILVAA